MQYGAVVTWWLFFLALSLVGLPIAATILRELPDRGAGLALPVALVLLWLPTYWVGHLAFGPVAIGAGVTILGAAAIWSAWRGVTVHWDQYFEIALVFTVAFGFLVAVRAVDPSIQPAGGEKFLDFGLLRSVLRGARLPPEDIWFAGEPVRYYYGGHLLAGSLSMVTDTPARYAYNLALAGIYGTLVAAAYGLAGSIGASRGGSYRLSGAFGAFFVGFASNLYIPIRQLLRALPAGIARPLTGQFEAATAVEAGTVLEDEFFYWTASRIVPGTINEFPLFAFLNGDLHAHMVSTPFLLLAAGIGFAYVLTPETAHRRRRVLVLGAVPPIAGLLAVVNTWSLPTAVGLAWLSMTFAPAEPATLLPGCVADRFTRGVRWEQEASRILAAGLLAIGVAGLSVLWALPFFLGAASGRSIAIVTDRSGAIPFLVVHGAFLLVFWTDLGVRLERAHPNWARPAAVAAVVLVPLGLAVDAAAVGLVLPVLLAAWIVLRSDADASFGAILIVAGAGLTLLIELLFVEELAGPGRLNTVFKVSMQIWILWAVAAGAILPRLIRQFEHHSIGAVRIDQVVAALCALLIIAVSLYGGFALGEHFVGSPAPTLDATTYASQSHPEEWAAIRYLGSRPGQPHIVSAPACYCHGVEGVEPYDWANAPSSFTGLPTVAGWQHEIGYRGLEPYQSRVQDVETIYTGPWDQRVALLRQYDVRYVYVGPNERRLYGDPGFAGRDGFTVAFENDAATVYAVNGEELA